MSRQMIETIGNTEYDGLIYDNKFPLDTGLVKIDSGQGILKRGTVLGVLTDKYTVLGNTANSVATCIICDEIDTGATGTTLMVEVYRAGHFNRNALIAKAGYVMTATDERNLKNAGLYLSTAMTI